jgi:hypothetical protein
MTGVPPSVLGLRVPDPRSQELPVTPHVVLLYFLVGIYIDISAFYTSFDLSSSLLHPITRSEFRPQHGRLYNHLTRACSSRLVYNYRDGLFSPSWAMASMTFW